MNSAITLEIIKKKPTTVSHDAIEYVREVAEEQDQLDEMDFDEKFQSLIGMFPNIPTDDVEQIASEHNYDIELCTIDLLKYEPEVAETTYGTDIWRNRSYLNDTDTDDEMMDLFWESDPEPSSPSAEEDGWTTVVSRKKVKPLEAKDQTSKETTEDHQKSPVKKDNKKPHHHWMNGYCRFGKKFRFCHVHYTKKVHNNKPSFDVADFEAFPPLPTVVSQEKTVVPTTSPSVPSPPAHSPSPDLMSPIKFGSFPTSVIV